MKFKLVVLTTFFVSFVGFSQTQLSIKDDFWAGKAIYQNDKKISVSEVKELVKDNAELLKKISAAQTNRTVGAVVGYPGSFVFGYTLGQSLGSQNAAVKPNWTVGGIGAVGMIIGMIMQYQGNAQVKEVVEKYNAGINKTSYLFKPEFNVTSSENGIGLAMRF
jgi:hypothetical protein